MPLMTVADLIEKLRDMPPGCFVGVEAADGQLTTQIMEPRIEIVPLSLKPANTDEDEEAFFLDFQIVDEAELQIVALRPSRSPGDQTTANDA